MLQKEAQANQAKGDVEGVDLWGRLTDFSTVVGRWRRYVSCNSKK